MTVLGQHTICSMYGASMHRPAMCSTETLRLMHYCSTAILFLTPLTLMHTTSMDRSAVYFFSIHSPSCAIYVHLYHDYITDCVSPLPSILSEAFEGLLPRDNPKNTRFAINFFTSIGLGGLT